MGQKQAWVKHTRAQLVLRTQTTEQCTRHPEAQHDSSQCQPQNWGVKTSDQALLLPGHPRARISFSSLSKQLIRHRQRFHNVFCNVLPQIY